MNDQQLPETEINQFLEDVKDQIQYKPIQAEIEEELKAHIEDRILEYMDMGIDEKVASHTAVEHMGDAASIGVMLNEARHVKNYWPLVGMVMAAIFMGVLNNIYYYRVNWEAGILDGIDRIISSMYYFTWGLIVLCIICYKGYTFVVKHAKLLLVSYVAVCLIERVIAIVNVYGLKRYYYSAHVLGYNWLLLFGPVIAVAAYRWRGKGKKAIFIDTVLLTAMIALQYISTRGFALTAILALMITSIITILYMIYKGYILGNKMKLFIWSLVGFVTVISIYGGISFTDQEENFQLFFSPEQQATDHWQDGYNGVLIKELLKRAELFGPIRLSAEELMNYGTGAWYFEEEEVADITYYLDYDVTNVTLADVLPQHYHNNYRFAYWILNYGWLFALILIAFVLSLFGMLFVATNKINNKLGHTLALSCSVCLSVQMILYLLGNFGYQYGNFSTLPFISEGLGSITTNMILVGMILSAYRYDNVIREEKYSNNVIKTGSV